jgi:pentatricopeptide repeat protein
MKRLRVFDRSSFEAPSPTSAKFKRRVARYFPDGDGTGATAADEKSDEKGAEKARETPAIEAVDEPDDPPVSEEVVEEELEEKPGVEPAKTGDEVEPVPYSSLAALDEGMARTMKSNRKRSRDAQTLLKRAVKTKEIKFFNRIIKDFGNDKQMGFAEEAFRRIGDAGLSPTVYSYTNLLNACVRVGELDRARKVWDDMIAAGVEPNEVTYTVLVKGSRAGRVARGGGEDGARHDGSVPRRRRVRSSQRSDLLDAPSQLRAPRGSESGGRVLRRHARCERHTRRGFVRVPSQGSVRGDGCERSVGRG